MRILHISKYLYRRGGAEAYMLDVAELQRKEGHEVEYFGMQHPDNGPFALEDLFPPFLATDPPPDSVTARARSVALMMWNPAAARSLGTALNRFEPDVVHVHNIYHQLSPSVLQPVKRSHIPMVMTLHDYKLACPTYQFLDQGSLCEACIGGHFSQAVIRRCKNGSRSASTVLAAESAVHRVFGAYGAVQIFVCPSLFMKAKMTEAGVYPDRMRHLPHFVEPLAPEQSAEPFQSTDDLVSDRSDADRPGGPSQPDQILFAGRLSAEKGVDVLLRAVPMLSASARVVICGDGPQRGELERIAAEVGPERVQFLGRLGRADLSAHMAGSLVSVVPSRWYENQPMTVLESFAAGTPVIGTNLGGIPEIIEPGSNGLIVEPNDPIGLAGAINDLIADRDLAHRMGRAGMAMSETRFSVSRHLEGLHDLYRQAALSTN